MKIKVKKVLYLLGWIYAKNLMTKNEFKYYDLYGKLALFDTEEDLDINEDTMSSIVQDTYDYYSEFKSNPDKVLENSKLLTEMNRDENMFEKIKQELNSFLDTFESLMVDYTIPKFKYQKIILNNLMEKSIHEENYEKCSKIRDRMKELK